MSTSEILASRLSMMVAKLLQDLKVDSCPISRLRSIHV